MAHLCLADSLLFEGTNFTRHETINRLLADPSYAPAVLYPGKQAVNLSLLPPAERRRAFPHGRRPLFFVIDGTWRTARKMRRLSVNLNGLPSFVLTPRRPSGFQIRKQPRPECLSTLEAIHELLDLFPQNPGREHDHLLEVFNGMVQTQIDFQDKHGRCATRGLRARE